MRPEALASAGIARRDGPNRPTGPGQRDAERQPDGPCADDADDGALTRFRVMMGAGVFLGPEAVGSLSGRVGAVICAASSAARRVEVDSLGLELGEPGGLFLGAALGTLAQQLLAALPGFHRERP